MERERLIDAKEVHAPVAFISYYPLETKAGNAILAKSDLEFGVSCVDIPSQGTALLFLDKFADVKMGMGHDLDQQLDKVYSGIYPTPQAAQFAGIIKIGQWLTEIMPGSEVDPMDINAMVNLVDKIKVYRKQVREDTKKDKGLDNYIILTPEENKAGDVVRGIHLQRFKRVGVPVCIETVRGTLANND